jgi:arylsulfatase A-like enzyme
VVGCAEAPPPPPNVVLIDVESLRADHLSHLGYRHPTASGLDALREEAALFAAARAPSSDTATSSASLLTGVEPWRHGVSGARPSLVPEVATLAERLAEQGFRTVAASHHHEISRKSGLARGFDWFESVPGPIESHPDAGVMLDWLREWLATRPEGPFFLYLHPTNPHSPYKVPPEHRGDLLGRPPTRAFTPGGELEQAVMSGHHGVRARVRRRIQRSLVEQYDTAVRYTLDRVGEMLELLRHDGSYQGALVIVTGNHGEELFDHGGFGHGATLYEEVLRVPLYLKLPGEESPRTIETPVSLLDVVPTVLDVLGREPGNLVGRSLAGLARGGAPAAGEPGFVAWLDQPRRAARARALLSGRYKLIDSLRRYDLPRGGVELYDLVLDPDESEDAAGSATAVVERLGAELDRRAPAR